MNTPQETYMRRAFQLAKLGLGNAAPNPLVGCVIVKDNQIIGEGYHQKYGEAHAEVNAVKSVKDPQQLIGAEVYVTLEPCSHYGKTPPCADMLVRHQVGTVYVANLDPNPLVAGRGLKRLRDAGIRVVENVLTEEGWEMNRRFFTFFEKKRPYIILKWAQTADGFVARKNYDSKWISNWLSRKTVHKWRTEEPAIMVGTNTAHYDNPKLNARDWQGKDPLRIVIDNQLRLSKELHLFSDGLPTYCYNQQQETIEGAVSYFRLGKENYLEQLMSHLRSSGIQSVFVEGGSYLLHQLIQENLWDELRIFSARKTLLEKVFLPQHQKANW